MHRHEKMCFTLAPASEWKEDTIEWIAHHAHSDVRQYAAQKKKQPLSEDLMFLTCYNKERIFFIRIDQPISYGIKKWLSYSPEPQVARFHPYVEIEEMFKKRPPESKQKAFIQQQRHTR